MTPMILGPVKDSFVDRRAADTERSSIIYTPDSDRPPKETKSMDDGGVSGAPTEAGDRPTH